MDRRQFLQLSFIASLGTIISTKINLFWPNGIAKAETGAPFGLPLCFPYCLPSSQIPIPLGNEGGKEYRVLMPMVSRSTNHGGKVVTMPRRQLFTFWRKH